MLKLMTDIFELLALTKACKLVNDEVKTRLPIGKGLLRIIIDEIIDRFALQPYLASMYVALVTVGYYGMLRVGELMNGDHTTKAEDIHIEKKTKRNSKLY